MIEGFALLSVCPASVLNQKADDCFVPSGFCLGQEKRMTKRKEGMQQ